MKEKKKWIQTWIKFDYDATLSRSIADQVIANEKVAGEVTAENEPEMKG